MNTGRIIRGVADTAFTVCRNTHTAALGDGAAVRWHVSGDAVPTGLTRIPGVDVVQTAAAGDTTVVGVTRLQSTIATVAQGDYMQVQVFGYHPNVKTTVAALAVSVVVSGDAAGAVVAAQVAGAGDITDKRIGVCVTTGAANRAGIVLASLGH